MAGQSAHAAGQRARLGTVEHGVSHLMELRAVCHQGDARLEAQVFVAAREMIRCGEINLGQRRKVCIPRGNQTTAEVLRILGLTELNPPAPPEG